MKFKNSLYMLIPYYRVVYGIKNLNFNWMRPLSTIPIKNIQLFSNKESFITNNNLPTCINCKHYTPSKYYSFDSTMSKCNKFGTRNIITNEISHDFCDFVRNDENKCGKIGHYFEKEKDIHNKIRKHWISNISYRLYFPLIITYFIIIIVFALSDYTTTRVW